MTQIRTITLTTIAMLAFAANSLLTRQALGEGAIDAASFGALRVVSGAVMLAIILALRGNRQPGQGGWRAALGLIAYIVGFSFAYLSLAAGTGALILFGVVQLTMFGAALRSGERFGMGSWAGLALALGGLVYLMAPGIDAPDPFGAVLMVIAGIGWGIYSLLGRAATDALAATARNFLLATPVLLLLAVVFVGQAHLTAWGAILAILSGALASGCGYVVWYAALRGLSAGKAGIVQLTVPVIAALGGAIFLSEPLTQRLLIASIITLGGVALVLVQRNRV